MFVRLSSVLVLISALLVGIWIGLRPHDQATRLTFFAVGQGDCALFQHGAFNVLIDAGPANEFSDAGKAILIPKLREMGVDRIDLVLLSHPDNDHIGGLASLARRVKIGKVAAMRHFREHSVMRALFQRSGFDESQVIWVSAPMLVQLGKFKLTMSAPPYSPGDQDNNGSMFVWLGDGKAAAVFSGDADMLTEASMIPRASWQAQVMKAGHHGSKFSTGPEWLEAVQPEYVVFSCGRNNTYGHPSSEALSRVEKFGARALRTDRDGTVTFGVGERGFELVSRP